MDSAGDQPAGGSGIGELQFQKAEFSEERPRCAACSSEIRETYCKLGEHIVCTGCADKLAEARRAPGPRLVARGAFYGLGVAVACSIGYAVLTAATGYEFALVAIAVGYAIGRAVRAGCSGLRARRCQVLAAVLTYLSVTTSYIPQLVKGAQKTQQTQQQTVSETPRVSGVQVAVALVVVEAIALGVPFLALGQGISGIIGLIIIFVGVQQAWRLNAPDRRPLTGPFASGGEPSHA